MKTTVTQKGQTTIPAAIREQYGLEPGDKLEWLDDGEVIRVIILPADPVKALRGSAKGEGLLDSLLAERRAERARDVGR